MILSSHLRVEFYFANDPCRSSLAITFFALCPFPRSKTSPCCFAPSQPKQTPKQGLFLYNPRHPKSCSHTQTRESVWVRNPEFSLLLRRCAFGGSFTHIDPHVCLVFACMASRQRPVRHCSHYRQILLPREWHDSPGVLEGKIFAEKRGHCTGQTPVLICVKRKVFFTTAICFGYLRV